MGSRFQQLQKKTQKSKPPARPPPPSPLIAEAIRKAIMEEERRKEEAKKEEEAKKKEEEEAIRKVEEARRKEEEDRRKEETRMEEEQRIKEAEAEKARIKAIMEEEERKKSVIKEEEPPIVIMEFPPPLNCISYFMTYPYSTRLFNSDSIIPFRDCKIDKQSDIFDLFNSFIGSLFQTGKEVEIRVAMPSTRGSEIPHWQNLDWLTITLQQGNNILLHIIRGQMPGKYEPVKDAQNNLHMRIGVDSKFSTTTLSNLPELLEMELTVFVPAEEKVTLSVMYQELKIQGSKGVFITSFDLKEKKERKYPACLPHQFVSLPAKECSNCDLQLKVGWDQLFLDNSQLLKDYLGELSKAYKRDPFDASTNLSCSFLRRNYLNIAPSYTLESKESKECPKRGNLFKYYNNSCYGDSSLIALFIHPNRDISTLLEERDVKTFHNYSAYTRYAGFFLNKVFEERKKLQEQITEMAPDIPPDFLEALEILNKIKNKENVNLFIIIKEEKNPEIIRIKKQFLEDYDKLIASTLKALKDAQHFIQNPSKYKQQKVCTDLRKNFFLLEGEWTSAKNLHTGEPIDFTRQILAFIGQENLPIEIERGPNPHTSASLKNLFIQQHPNFMQNNPQLTFYVFASPGFQLSEEGEKKFQKLIPEPEMDFPDKHLKLILNSVVIFLYNHYGLYFRCPGTKDLWWFYDDLSERPLEAAHYDELKDYFSVYGTLFFYQEIG